jgi:hypothetical protein
LLTSDGNPKWFVHPVHKHEVDVVAIPLPQAQGDQTYLAINRLSRELLSIQIGMDVFVIGFPFTPRAPWLSTWKRGSIASEPQMVGLADPYHLVDTASRPGMSGAPVVLRSYGAHLTESGPSGTTAPATRFFGIYSGRLHTKELDDAQLGRVWPERTIIEIIDAEFRDPGGWG